MIGLTLGQQSWLRLLNIEHHEVLAGTTASMAPGFENAEALKEAKAAADYWRRSLEQGRSDRSYVAKATSLLRGGKEWSAVSRALRACCGPGPGRILALWQGRARCLSNRRIRRRR